ncbi:MAG: endonuclease Q family protein [Patescibacteria group bacterium]
MRLITDFHLHSKWSRACSKDLTLPNIAKGCERKGIALVGTGDAFHPAWRADIGSLLEEIGPGIFALRDGSSPVRFILSTEISCIYKRGDAVRRVHHLVLFPSLVALDRLTQSLNDRKCNLKSDGRPIVGIDSEELLKMVLDADPKCLLIPAHAWTPWFSVFGSKSGFDSLEECFGDLASNVYAIETGLSSDPAMNWRLSGLDRIFLVSNSDAHSCENLGREANVFEMEEPSYPELYRILSQQDTSKFVETIEFFPEEGKYHMDGHRACDFCCTPEETKRLRGICPKCGKPLVIGVLNRIAELADRPPQPLRPAGSVPFRSIVPLRELVADALGVGKTSQKVQRAVNEMLSDGRSEFSVLLDLPKSELARFALPDMVESIINMRAGNVEIRPGYDGEYGIVKAKGVKKKQQESLF